MYRFFTKKKPSIFYESVCADIFFIRKYFTHDYGPPTTLDYNILVDILILYIFKTFLFFFLLLKKHFRRVPPHYTQCSYCRYILLLYKLSIFFFARMPVLEYIVSGSFRFFFIFIHYIV